MEEQTLTLTAYEVSTLVRLGSYCGSKPKYCGACDLNMRERCYKLKTKALEFIQARTKETLQPERG